jgi:hypothetical protein
MHLRLCLSVLYGRFLLCRDFSAGVPLGHMGRDGTDLGGVGAYAYSIWQLWCVDANDA